MLCSLFNEYLKAMEILLLDKNKVLEQHDFFRIFATTNAVGLGDTTGLYHGTQQINQGQMDDQYCFYA